MVGYVTHLLLLILFLFFRVLQFLSSFVCRWTGRSYKPRKINHTQSHVPFNISYSSFQMYKLIANDYLRKFDRSYHSMLFTCSIREIPVFLFFSLCLYHRYFSFLNFFLIFFLFLLVFTIKNLNRWKTVWNDPFSFNWSYNQEK